MGEDPRRRLLPAAATGAATAGRQSTFNYALAAETGTDLGVVISPSQRFKPTPVQSATAADCISCVLLTH